MSLEKDLGAMKDKISEKDLSKLIEYINLNAALGVNMLGKTYDELLNEIKVSETKENFFSNEILIKDFQQMLNERLENDLCDEVLNVTHNKGYHKNNGKNDDEDLWYEDEYYIDY
tara:strand:+ start:269 stop:613 length:345 start_codon:yes stop_codon:yes gene_type:complete